MLACLSFEAGLQRLWWAAAGAPSVAFRSGSPLPAEQMRGCSVDPGGACTVIACRSWRFFCCCEVVRCRGAEMCCKRVVSFSSAAAQSHQKPGQLSTPTLRIGLCLDPMPCCWCNDAAACDVVRLCRKPVELTPATRSASTFHVRGSFWMSGHCCMRAWSGPSRG